MSGVMEIIQRQAAEKSGLPYDEEQGKTMREYMMKDVEQKSEAWYSTGQLWDDGVIDPRDTRTVLGICLAAINNTPIESSRGYGVFRM